MSTKNYSGSANVLELKNVCQQYGDFTLFNDLNLAITDKPDAGQAIAIMGESGCGKSHVLKYITGLQKPTSGSIELFGQPLKETDTIPMVFQTPSSLEWFTVIQNVALPLTLKGVPKKEAYAKAQEMIDIVGLTGHENKFAKAPNLSGGQLQRVAIARSLVANPTMLMLDEPFSALDLKNRTKMQFFLADLFKKSEFQDLNPTILLVTHDAREAVFLASDIYIMGANPGRIKEHIQVPEWGEKTPALRKSDDFLKLVAYVDAAVEEEV